MRTLPALMPVLRMAAWLALAVLTLFWVMEMVYCVQYYSLGGWPALLGYLQSTAEGHRAGPPPSWTSIGLWHLVFLAIMLSAIWFLRWSRRAGSTEPAQ